MDYVGLINKVLSGKASENEISLLNQWLESDPSNREEYEDIRFVLSGIDTDSEKSRPNDRGLMDIISRIESLKRDGTRSKIKTMSVLVLFILLLALVIFGASTDWTFQNRVEVLKNTVSFEDVKLAYVLDTLEMESSFDFHVNTKELLECRFTGTFYKGASIEQAIRTLSKSIPFNYSMQNRRTYVIQGKGCKA